MTDDITKGDNAEVAMKQVVMGLTAEGRTFVCANAMLAPFSDAPPVTSWRGFPYATMAA